MSNFTELNLFDFFQNNQEKPLVKAEEEKDIVSSDEDFDDETSDVVTTSSSKKKKVSKNNSSKLTGKSAVTLPCYVHGRNFFTKVNNLSDKTYNGLVRHLYDLGFKEVVADVSVISHGDKIYISSPQNETSSNTAINTERPVTVIDGNLQCECVAAAFPDFDADEISVFHMAEKWSNINGMYASCGLHYSPEKSIAVPVLTETVTNELTLPVTVNRFGDHITIDKQDFPLKEKITVDELINFAFPDVKANIKLKKGENIIFAEFEDSKNTVSGLDTTFAKVTSTTVKTVVEKYKLPFTVYFVTLGIQIPISAEIFPGKNKVTEEEVLDYLRRGYSILRNKDRSVECFYSPEKAMLSVAVTSGKKGADTLFSNISSEEIPTILKKDFVLGYHIDKHNVKHRIEINEVAGYIGTYDSHSSDISSVALYLKTPRIPKKIWEMIIQDFKTHHNTERILQVVWDLEKKEYHLIYPTNENAGVDYIQYTFDILPEHKRLVATIHSHNSLPAFFSATDDQDELYTGIFGVVGKIDSKPEAKFRVGMEGNFSPISFYYLFEEE